MRNHLKQLAVFKHFLDYSFASDCNCLKA